MSLIPAWREAAETAEQSARDTANLTPRLGRARPLAERSMGTPDAGATSMAMIIAVVGNVLVDSVHRTEIASPA
jgi:dihydroxyacetone kinase